MKTVLCLCAFLVITLSAKSQDLIFSINQSGVAYKNTGTNYFNEAELKSTDIVITMQDKVVTVMDDLPTTISLEKMNGQNNNIKHLYTQIWKASDDKKMSVQFKFTVNVENREAMVEVAYKDHKSYYFGKYSYGNADPLKPAGEIPSASN